jgi:hypothetical protein
LGNSNPPSFLFFLSLSVLSSPGFFVRTVPLSLSLLFLRSSRRRQAGSLAQAGAGPSGDAAQCAGEQSARAGSACVTDGGPALGGGPRARLQARGACGPDARRPAVAAGRVAQARRGARTRGPGARGRVGFGRGAEASGGRPQARWLGRAAQVARTAAARLGPNDRRRSALAGARAASAQESRGWRRLGPSGVRPGKASGAG